MDGGKLLIRGGRRLARIGIEAAFPLRCWQCESLYPQREIDLPQVEGQAAISFYRLMTPYLCRSCAAGFMPVLHPLCPICGKPFRTEHGVDHTCSDCHGRTQGFEAARAVAAFDDPLNTLIHQYKYQGRTELARPFGKLLWEALLGFYDPLEFDLIVPVPLHWYRRYRRGFNQAALLLRDWHQYAVEAGIHWSPHRVSYHALNRRRRTSAQTNLSRKERAVNLKDAFVASRAEALEGKRFLLVDDVLTTGATATECAKALKRAGADAVKVLTLARAV